MIEESRRQQQVGSLLQRFLAEIFLVRGQELVGVGAMVTIASVRLTKDLTIARVYLSIFNAQDRDASMTNIKINQASIKRELGNKLRNKMRHIPNLEFYLDDTLDEVMKLEELFIKINQDRADNPLTDSRDEDYKD